MLDSGELGLTTFAHILADPRTRDLPLVLETPAYDEPGSGAARLGEQGMQVWRKEVEVLNRLAGVGVGVGMDTMGEWAREIGDVVARASEKRGAKGKKVAEGGGGRGKTKGKRKRGEGDEEECESCSEDS